MISPTRRAVLAVAAGLPAAALPVLDGGLWPVWVAYNALCVLLIGADFIWSPSNRAVGCDVECPDVVFLGDHAEAKVSVTSRGRPPRQAQALLDVSGPLQPLGPQDVSDLSQGVSIPLQPTRRGVIEVEDCWLRWTGPLGLVCRTKRFVRGVPHRMKVVPNVRAVRSAALRLNTTDTYIAGMKSQSFVGDGSEFEALRKYMPGLDHRSIDWKASARHLKLLCRENRAERNHRVVLAFDTGRLMGDSIDGLPRLDHAINAGLLMAYLSLRMGDQVGLFAFDAAVRSYRAPRPGVRTFPALGNACAELDYTGEETNFTLALADLSARLRRRSIVVVMTDFTDTVGAELMIENITRLGMRHLVLFVALRDPGIDAVAHDIPSTMRGVNRAVVAEDIRRERATVLLQLRRRGILCIDATPQTVGIELVNRYLDVHRRELA